MPPQVLTTWTPPVKWQVWGMQFSPLGQSPLTLHMMYMLHGVEQAVETPPWLVMPPTQHVLPLGQSPGSSQRNELPPVQLIPVVVHVSDAGSKPVRQQ